MSPLSPLLRSYDQVILDLDGCVWIGDEAVAGSVEAIAALRAAGKRIAFATNNGWHAGEDHVAKLWGIGVQASLGDVVTVGGAMQHLLVGSHPGASAFVIGTAAMRKHVSDAGLKVMNGTDLASRAEVVVVSGTDDVHYADLRDAALAVTGGAAFFATGRDPTLPMPDGHWPGTGAILAAVETASGSTAEIVGKPSPRLFETALDRLGDGRTLVVGDRLDADIAAADAAGLDGALVLTGGGPSEAGPGEPVPVRVAADLAELVGAG